MDDVVPVTIIEELEAGYRYAVSYKGTRVELLTQPHTMGLDYQVGDLVMARLVGGQLFAPAPTRQPFLVGSFDVTSPSHTNLVFHIRRLGSWGGWKQLFNQLFSDPGNYPYFGHVFWWAEKRKLYGCKADYDSTGSGLDLYEINVQTGKFRALGLQSLLEPDGPDIWSAIKGTCVFGDYVYLLALIEYDSPYLSSKASVFRFDGVTVTRVDLAEAGTPDDAIFDGNKIATDGSCILYLYRSLGDGYWHVRKSTDGTTWAEEANLGPSIVPSFPSRLLYNPAIARFQCAGIGNYIVERDSNGTWAKDVSIGSGGIWDIGFRYASDTDVNPIRQYAVVGNYTGGNTNTLWSRPATGGNFSQETEFPIQPYTDIYPDPTTLDNINAITSLNGSIFIAGHINANKTFYIYRRDSDLGDWTLDGSIGNRDYIGEVGTRLATVGLQRSLSEM